MFDMYDINWSKISIEILDNMDDESYTFDDFLKFIRYIILALAGVLIYFTI